MRRPGCIGANEYGCSTVMIHLDTPAGRVAMESCSACDQRWWHRDGEEIEREVALDAVARSRP